MTTQELAVDLIACFEGCRLTAYQDTGGVWTVGFGETGPDVTEGVTRTYDEAWAWLQDRVASLLPLVADLPVPHAAALASFGYNCGRGALLNVIAGHDTIANPIHYTDRHGNVLTGLRSRRQLEEALMLL